MLSRYHEEELKAIMLASAETRNRGSEDITAALKGKQSAIGRGTPEGHLRKC